MAHWLAASEGGSRTAPTIVRCVHGAALSPEVRQKPLTTSTAVIATAGANGAPFSEEHPRPERCIGTAPFDPFVGGC